MGICSSFVVKEWNEALGPYGLSDIHATSIFQAASHGALEALADQWRIQNVALALAPQSKFSGNATSRGPNLNIAEDSSLSGPQAQPARRAVAKPACTGPSRNITDTMPHEEQEQLAKQPVRKSQRRVASEDALGLGLEKWLRQTDPCRSVAKRDGSRG